MGFIGVETIDGDFKVKEIIYPSFKPRIDIDIQQQDSWIALVSGLHLGTSALDISIELLVDFLTADKSISDVISFIKLRKIFQCQN